MRTYSEISSENSSSDSKLQAILGTKFAIRDSVRISILFSFLGFLGSFVSSSFHFPRKLSFLIYLLLLRRKIPPLLLSLSTFLLIFEIGFSHLIYCEFRTKRLNRKCRDFLYDFPLCARPFFLSLRSHPSPPSSLSFLLCIEAPLEFIFSAN